jgi:hypothetical protein
LSGVPIYLVLLPHKQEDFFVAIPKKEMAFLVASPAYKHRAKIKIVEEYIRD